MRTWLAELSDEECTARLTGAVVGRLGVVVAGVPEIFPVNHAYEPETGGVVFPTNPRTKLHAALSWPQVAFEVDGCDADGAGWSVLVVGPAEQVHDQQVVERARTRRHAVWAVSAQTVWLRITPSKITGRRITLSP